MIFIVLFFCYFRDFF